MVHGAYWGVGQSTLTRGLAGAIPEADVLWEDELSQPAIFTRLEFAAVAERFHRHNAEPSAGVGHPPPEMLEGAYRALVRTLMAHGRTGLMGWSVMDLAEDLDWARSDEGDLGRHSAAVRAIFEPLDPVLVYLDGDLEAAFERAVAQRGREWFSHGQPVDESQWQQLAQKMKDEMSVAAGRIWRAFSAGGWFPAVQVDGTRLGVDQVFGAVADQLRRRGIELTGLV